MTGGWRTRARALPCVHRASRNEQRVLGTEHWLHQCAVAFPQAWECFQREKLFRGLRREQTQALAQIIVEAWPHEQTAHRISSSLGDGGLLGGAHGADSPEPLVVVPDCARRKDCARGTGPRPFRAPSAPVYVLACRWPMAQCSGTASRMKQRRLARRICACWLTLCSRKLLRAAVAGESDLELQLQAAQ